MGVGWGKGDSLGKGKGSEIGIGLKCLRIREKV